MKITKGIVVMLITLCLVFALVACSNGSFDPKKANGGNEEGGGNGGGNGGNGGEGGGEEGIPVNTTNPLTLEATEAGTIDIYLSAGSIRYMKNKDGNLVTCDATDKISVNKGDIVQLWGDGSHVFENMDIYDEPPLRICYLNKLSCYVYGNVMSLLDAVNYPDLKNIAKANAFTKLFEDSNIISHPDKKLELPATTLAPYCYYKMFYNTKLTIAPELPAKQLASYCYADMFGKTSLTTAPELPAQTLYENCYAGMFAECTSLSTAPQKLPATILSPYCYSGMFWECSKLKKAPEMLVAIVKSYCCSGMFSGCSSLSDITKVKLSAETLEQSMGCYSEMFRYTAIEESPVLPATTLVEDCYKKMFYDCQKLTKVTCLATTKSATGCTEDWLKITDQEAGRPNGTLYRAENVAWDNNDSGYPKGWSLVDYVP